MMNVNEIMAQLAQYNRMKEETDAIIEGLKDQLKQYMIENKLDTLTGDEHKAIYKAVESSRVDTKRLKDDLPNIADLYTVTTATMRFTFS